MMKYPSHRIVSLYAIYNTSFASCLIFTEIFTEPGIEFEFNPRYFARVTRVITRQVIALIIYEIKSIVLSTCVLLIIDGRIHPAGKT